MKDLITEIWEIRGMVDNAVVNKDKELFEKALNRFNEVATVNKSNRLFNTIYNEEEPIDDKEVERAQNLGRLTINMGYQMARVNQLDVDTKPFGKPKCIIDVIWLSRAMFDDSVYSSSNPKEKEKNLRRLNAVEDKLEECYGNLLCSTPERKSLMGIMDQIHDTRITIFGTEDVQDAFETESAVY